MSTKPRKRKDKEANTSYDEPKRHIVLSWKRNIVGVKDTTDMLEDYEKFHEIAPFTMNIDPTILLNDENFPWLRRKGTHANKKFYTPRSHSGMWPASLSSLSSLWVFRLIYLESSTSDQPEGIFVIARVLMCFGIWNAKKYYVQTNIQPFLTSFAIFQLIYWFFELKDPEIEMHYKWTLKRLKVGMVSSFHPHSMC